MVHKLSLYMQINRRTVWHVAQMYSMFVVPNCEGREVFFLNISTTSAGLAYIIVNIVRYRVKPKADYMNSIYITI
jgi:hypothetical protein